MRPTSIHEKSATIFYRKSIQLAATKPRVSRILDTAVPGGESCTKICLRAARLFEREDVQAKLAWPHSGFHVRDAVLVPDGDVAFALRLAR